VSEGEGWDPSVEDVDPPPSASGFEEHPPAVPGETTWWQPARAPGPMVATMPWEEPPAPKRRRWRKVLLVSLVVLLLLGGSGAGAKAYVDHRHEVAEKARIAAEKRAADAYVKAVRPLAIRVFDALQPIHDAFDDWGERRPGIWTATEDVVRRSGAERELVVVDKALTRLTVPVTHKRAAASLETAVKGLTVSVRELGKAFVGARKADACPTCDKEDAFVAATDDWVIAIARLMPTPPISAPASERTAARGRAVPTWGGFILASDLACGAAQHKLSLLPDRSDASTYKNWPALARIVRSTVASLRPLKVPASRRVPHQRLDKQLQAAAGYASTLDRAHSAVKNRSLPQLKRALAGWDEDLVAFRDLSSTYKKFGVTNCSVFFGVPEKELPKEYRT
jgi:hypothetical protein